MAHLLVYLQRTPWGLHPASALSLCVGRDLASRRGATLTGICLGDGGAFDERIVGQAASLGADIVQFVGTTGLAEAHKRLRPRHVIAPWTQESAHALEGAGIGPLVPHWIGGPPDDEPLDPISGVVAGALPWRALSSALDPDYGGDVGEVPMPSWLDAVARDGSPRGPLLVFTPQGEAGLPAEALADIEDLGGRALPAAALETEVGEIASILWLDSSSAPLPSALVSRSPFVRLLLLPGPEAQPTPDWGAADFVLPGEWRETIGILRADAWRAAIA